ncbi:MAG: protein-L-isoaspartate O-methyltransferase family protein [Acidiphilium sp.]
MTDHERYFRAARALMVDGQVRPNNVVEDRIVSAMRTLRRERFCPPGHALRAYADADLELDNGRAMPSPLTIGRLVQAAALRSGERALVIGANTGYGAAVLAGSGAIVFALEEDAALRAIAERALGAEAPEVRLLAGPLTAGARTHAPFDLILIEGMIDVLPDGLIPQLSPKGRLIAVLRERGIGRIVRAEASGGRFAHRALGDCAAPVLPAFRRKPEFVF